MRPRLMARTLPGHLQTVDLRQRILDEADALLSREGYAGLTMDALGRRVGIAKGTIYLYFGNKLDVAVSVIDRIFHRVLARLSDIGDTYGAPAERLHEMLIARVMLRHRALAHYRETLQPVLHALRPSLHENRKRHRAEEVAIFAAVIEQACQTLPSFAGVNAVAVARSMLWATDALLPSYLSAGELRAPSRIKAAATELADLLVRGFLVMEQSDASPKRPDSQSRRKRLTRSPQTLGFAVALCSSVLVQAQPSKHPMTVEDRFRFVDAGAPLVSPDGNWVLFTRAQLTLSDNARHTTTWLARTHGDSTSASFLREGDAAPMWAPDSRSVYFFRTATTGENRHRELFQQTIGDSVAMQLSALGTDGGGDWQLSRDGTFFLISKDEQKASGPGAESDVVYVDEGSNGQVRYYWSNLWRYDLASRARRRITQRDWSINTFDLSPDGRWAVVEAAPDNQRNTGWKTELYLVEMENGATRQLTHNAAPERSPHWSPDGTSVLFTAVRLDSWQNGNGDLWLLNIASGSIRDVTPGHTGRFTQPVFSPDGGSIYAGSGYGTTRFPVRIDVASGKTTRLIATAGVAAVNSWSADRSVYAYRYSDNQTPPDLYIGTVGDIADKQRRISDLNPWIRRDIALGSVELVHWQSTDGYRIEGLLIRPPANGPDRNPRAMIVHVPCGPGCGWVNDFSLKNQVYAGLGYVQLSVVVRGSNNYDDPFMQANYFDLGGGDLRDVMTGVNAMIARRIAHPDSLAIDGWSYGAILGGYILTQDTRFKAASLGAMVSDWTNDYGTSANYSGIRWFFGGTPWTNPKWRERSSLTHADKIRTPTLLHHGDDDDTDLPFHSMNFYAALRNTGTPVRYIRYPGEGHDLRQPAHLQLRDAEDVAWMERYVRGKRFMIPIAR